MVFSPYGCAPDEIISARLTNSADQNYTKPNEATLLLDTLNFDTGSFYSAAVPNTLTVPSAGYYLIDVELCFSGTAQPGVFIMRLKKNGVSMVAFSNTYFTSTDWVTPGMRALIPLVAGDAVRVDIQCVAQDCISHCLLPYLPTLWIARLASS